MVFGGELKKYRKNKLFLLMFFTLLFITGITFYYSNYRLKFSPEEYREIHRELEGKNLEDVNEFLQEEWEKYGFSELYEIDLHSYRMVIEQLQKETDNVRLYEKYLEKVENQYRENQEISIFQSADSYNEKNFEKIYQSYKNLEVKGKMGIQPILGIEQLIKFSFRDIVGILFLFYCVGVGIFQEKKRGMLSFLQVTYKGRKKQYFLKIAGLTVCMISWEILSFFVCYLIGQQQFGWADFSYAVQSVPMLMQSTYRMTIGTFLAGYLLMRIAVYFGLVVFVTMLSFVISSFAGAVTVASACLGGSFLMYQQISDVDSIPFLKRCNLWQMLRAEDIFGKCIYIRLGNEPIPLWVCVGVFAVFVLACYVIGKLFFQSQQEKNQGKESKRKEEKSTYVCFL